MSSIKQWAEDDKPREKYLLQGKGVLSDAELIAILLRSGSAENNAIELARIILQSVDHDLRSLARLTVKDLCRFPGVGEVKAITLLSALELGGRKESGEAKVRKKISSSSDAYQVLKWRLEDLTFEEFWILTLSRNNSVLKEHKVSGGGVAGTVVDAKRVFKLALDDQASGIILCHNHPSGNLKPSPQDLSLTQNIKSGAKLLDMVVLDHLIIAGNAYFSFADEGIL